MNINQPFLDTKKLNSLSSVNSYVTNDNTALDQYTKWLDQQSQISPEFKTHPTDIPLNTIKQFFNQNIGINFSSYIQIKRTSHILFQNQKYKNTANFSYISTPLGLMLGIIIDNKLSLLQFLENSKLDKDICRIKNYQFEFTVTELHIQIQKELNEYFLGNRKEFQIPLHPMGTVFQKQVWNTLQKIPYGNTISYQEEAQKLDYPSATRAVANANGKNLISIIIPCHRVIRKNGHLGGYSSGVERKQLLLSLERMFCK